MKFLKARQPGEIQQHSPCTTERGVEATTKSRRNGGAMDGTGSQKDAAGTFFCGYPTCVAAKCVVALGAFQKFQ